MDEQPSDCTAPDTSGQSNGDAASKPLETESQSSLYEDAQTQAGTNQVFEENENHPSRSREAISQISDRNINLQSVEVYKNLPVIRTQQQRGTIGSSSVDTVLDFSVERDNVELTGFADAPELLHIHQAIKDDNISTLYRLLEQGEDPNIADENGVRPLYFAAGLGRQRAVELLLTAGADVESFNPQSATYSTALHKAIGGNHVEIAEMLLQKGAYIDAVNRNGNTSLMEAVRNRNIDMIHLLLRYGADKESRDRSGATALSYATGDEEIMALLQTTQLLQGPPTTTRTQSHSPVFTPIRTPEYNKDKTIASHGYQATVVDFFIGGSFEYRMEKSLSIYDLLYGPQIVMEAPQQSSYGGNKRDFRWYHLPENNLEWVEDLMRRHMVETKPSSQVLSETFKSLAGLSGGRDRLHSTAMTPLSYMRPTCRSFKVRISSESVNWKEYSLLAHKVGPDGEDSTQENIMAFVPYLHFETHNRYEAMVSIIKNVLQSNTSKQKTRNDQGKQTNRSQEPPRTTDRNQDVPDDPELLYNHLVQGYLTTGSPGKGPSLQTRRTLDQYFYTHLDTLERDKDQVVYRYARLASLKEPKIFMVDQLWLWIINGDTIITCAPASIDSQTGDAASTRLITPEASVIPEPDGQRVQSKSKAQASWIRNRNTKRTRHWVAELALSFQQPKPTRHGEPSWTGNVSDDTEDYNVDMKYRPLNVQHNIFRYLRTPSRAPISSTHELASVITNHCADVFDHHDIPSDYQFFDFFERSIGRSDQAARRLKSFCRAAAFLSGEEVKRQLSIEVEAGLLVEIEDIHDELIILKMFLKDQQAILQDLSNVLDPPGYDPNHNFYGEYLSLKGNRLLGTHLQRIETMESMTRKTTKTIRSLLDLKQKQATIAEALSTVSYAKQEAEQAEESTRQGRTLMLFTVVTILFLPLSFMAAFFAINIDVFPVNENGKLELSYVLKYMLSISAGLSVPFIIVAFNQERFVAWLRYARPRLSSGYILFAAILILMSGILAALWTSPLEYTSKLGATIATLLLAFICFMVAGIYQVVIISKRVLSVSETSPTETGI
ncbi:hypothetical protein F4775DRAFT_60436 [Biscogniauxia sp. FL1348]|nr:hypothetical protein F4775DRAFT_60436 [Biscogniauxia sp. FL1348]